jgi:hypothetical protein
MGFCRASQISTRLFTIGGEKFTRGARSPESLTGKAKERPPEPGAGTSDGSEANESV